MYNSYYQTNPTPTVIYQPRQVVGLKGRPVSSVEEVRSSAIDFDGSIFYFPDIANNCIYTKQINLDGTATLLTYELRENPIPEQANFVTREEFENVLAQLKNHLATAQ
jgi:hypothetical protein